MIGISVLQTRILLAVISAVLVGCGSENRDERDERSSSYQNETEYAVWGDQVGNGGHLVVCRDINQDIIGVELYDYYEGRLVSDINQSLVGYDAMEMVGNALAPLQNLDPLRYAAYMKSVRSFFRETKFVDADLVDTNDSVHTIEPRDHCEMEQFAVQKQPLNQIEPRYLIDRELWRTSDIDTRAGLILHEVIYRHAIAKGHRDSRAVRMFNSLLSSGYFDEVHAERSKESEYRRIIDDLNL